MCNNPAWTLFYIGHAIGINANYFPLSTPLFRLIPVVSDIPGFDRIHWLSPVIMEFKIVRYPVRPVPFFDGNIIISYIETLAGNATSEMVRLRTELNAPFIGDSIYPANQINGSWPKINFIQLAVSHDHV